MKKKIDPIALSNRITAAALNHRIDEYSRDVVLDIIAMMPQEAPCNTELILKKILADMNLTAAGSDDMYQLGLYDGIKIVEGYLEQVKEAE